MNEKPQTEQGGDDAQKLARHERMPVGVIVERRPAANPWGDFVWRAVAIVPGAAPTALWTVTHEDAGTTQFFAGNFELELHPRETFMYRENLLGHSPSAYVVLHPDPTAEPHGVAVRFVTVSPGDAEAYMDGAYTVDPVSLPDVIEAWLEDYVAQFHVDEAFRKRKRKPHDPRKGFGRGSGSNDYGS